MMNRFLNGMLVLSLVANLALVVWLKRSESKSPEVSQQVLQHSPLVPEERTRLTRLDSLGASKPKAGHDRAQIAVPWALAKASMGSPSRDQFEIPEELILGLELTEEEKEGFDRAMGAFRSALREIELAGLQQSDDHIIRVVLDHEAQQAALGEFVKQLEETLPLSKAKILAEVSSMHGYLEWISLQLEVLNRKNGLRLKVSRSLDISDRSPDAPLIARGLSRTDLLDSQALPGLRERWGHLVDFDPLDDLMNQKSDE